jgi:uncharacterized protein (DUF983 family)
MPMQPNARITMTPPIPTGPKHAWVTGMVLQRCPKCRTGRIFNGMFSMNRSCPVCGLPFRREEGFWLGAMYFSYLFAVAILVPFYFLFQWLFPHWPGLLVASVAMLPYIPLTPIVFRYSRTMWIYFEDFVEPSELSSPRR